MHASGTGMGAVLEQKDDGRVVKRVIAYALQMLNYQPVTLLYHK